MKLFLDTVDIPSIERWAPFIDGLTTNPTLLARAGKDPRELIPQILHILSGKEVSIEVTESEPDAMYKQAHTIAALGTNVLVKIPCHSNYYELIATLVREGVRLNITLVFSVFQAYMMNKLGVAYISPFLGRLDDYNGHGVQVLNDMCYVRDTYHYTTKVLAASIRQVHHVHESLLAGVDAITMPIHILEEATSHQLTDQGIATFVQDWKKLGSINFP